MFNHRRIRNELNRWFIVSTICVATLMMFVGFVRGLQIDEVSQQNLGAAETSSYEELQKIILENGEADDEFGTFIDMDGEFAVISAYRKDVEGKEEAGAVYVYQRTAVDPEKWENVSELIPNDVADIYEFGVPVAISGDYVAVGAPFAHVDGVFGSPGAVYLFSRNEGGVDNWGQVAKLAADDLGDGDFFGHWLGFDGTYLVVGAARQGTLGAVYIFQQQLSIPNDWEQIQKILPDEQINIGGFGNGLDLSGDTLVVGADEGQGAVYIYQLESSVFTPTQVLTVTNDVKGFGESVAIMGDTLVVGAPNDSYLENTPGVSYIFEKGDQTASWELIKELEAGDADGDNAFGFTVSLWEDTVVIGARLNDAAYVFHRDAGGFNYWGQVKKLMASDNVDDASEEFGMATAVQGETAFIGARYTTNGENDNQGAAYVFRVAPTFAVTATSIGTGSGFITSSIPGIDCGLTCTASFPIGAVVTVTAVPDSDWFFAGWSGDCLGLGNCMLTMTQTQQVTATFTTKFNAYLPTVLNE